MGFIDAPEMEQQWGEEAQKFLTNLISGRRVWISVLKKESTQKTVDRFRRLLACVHVVEELSGEILGKEVGLIQQLFTRQKSALVPVNVELEMVVNGWAWVLDHYQPDDIYLDALRYAQENKLGMWSTDNNIHPIDFKQRSRGPKAKQNLQNTVSKGSEMACPLPACDGFLVERSGRYGLFYGCSNFPKCKYSQSSHNS